MGEHLKERIVGAVVLTALAVIFLPELLRPPAPTAESGLSIEKPPRPPLVKLAEPARPDSPRMAKAASPEPGAGSSRELDTANRGRGVNEGEDRNNELTIELPEGLEAWVVQVATFAHHDNALKLRDQLRSAGYSGFIEPYESKERTLYRVRVGPELQRSRAEKSLTEIRDQFALEGELRRHP